MSLWVDKYRPSSLDSLDYHKEQAEQFKKMVDSGNFPHLLFYGPSGAGKKTRVLALLREIYGPGAAKLKLEHKTFQYNSKNLELTLVSSAYHIEMNPSDLGNQDRIVMQEAIKEIAQSHPIDASARHAFKVVVLNEVDKLTREAQHALRRTMEKYMSACRLFLVCNSTARVIEPIRSRCLGIRVAAPSNDQIVDILKSISLKESFKLPNEVAVSIAEAAQGNTRRAILMLESAKVKQYPFPADGVKIEQPDWEEFIIQLAKEIAEEQSPARLLTVRGKLYELLTHCIPPEVIMRRLTTELMKKLDNELKYELIHWAAFYEHRLQAGSKAIFHLEAFVAKFMSVYKKYLMANYDF